ncbi:MAG: hypothetical protein AAFU03_00280, partial [Bacteroidota bacterium]
LKGEEAYDHYLANPSLSRYDQLFSLEQASLSTEELRAAGLTGLREILARRYRLRNYLAQLVAARRAIDATHEHLKSIEEKGPLSFSDLKDTLTNRIGRELTHFMKSRDDSLQLVFLANLTQEIVTDNLDNEARLAAISIRLDEFSEARPEAQSPNYLRLHPPAEPEESYQGLEILTQEVEAEFELMYTALETFSQRNAGDLIRAHRNAANFETVFGLGKELFFFLYDKPTRLATVDTATLQSPSSIIGTTTDGPDRATASTEEDESAGSFTPDLAVFANTTITPYQEQADFAEMGIMTTYLLDKAANPIVRGLALERLRRVPGLGDLNPAGIGDLVIDFTEQLSLLKNPTLLEGVDRKAMGRIQMVEFITRTVSSVVGAPIFNNPLNLSEPESLANRFPGFAKVPAVNDNLNELFRLSQTGRFRYAVTNLINLVDLFEIIPEASKKQKRMVARREQLRIQLEDLQDQGLSDQGLALAAATPIDAQQLSLIQDELKRLNRRLKRLDTARVNRNREQLFLYGTFMADVAAAETPDAFGAALNSVALPPGSSQLKRNKPFSMELNAYFGISFANERLNLPDDLPAEVELPARDSRTASLYVPVGLSMSWKGSYSQKSSYSLFFPLIDLGAVSAYRFDADNQQVERLPRFTFQNVFAPGAHLLYNFANTPFSFGLGAQYGPSLRRIYPDGSPFLDVSAVRFMATFSVDVPIFSFANRP